MKIFLFFVSVLDHLYVQAFSSLQNFFTPISSLQNSKVYDFSFISPFLSMLEHCTLTFFFPSNASSYLLYLLIHVWCMVLLRIKCSAVFSFNTSHLHKITLCATLSMCNATLCAKSIRYVGCKMWNDLPFELKSDSRISFNIIVKKIKEILWYKQQIWRCICL